MARPRTKSDGSFVAFGSEEHKALLGIATEKNPERQAELEEALATAPVPVAAVIKVPINKRSYEKGERIIDGWKRR